MLDNNYRDVVSDKGDYSDVRHTDIAMPVRRWLSGERNIKSLISNFDKSFTKLGIENNIRKYEPPKRKPDLSILGTDDEKVTQPATMGIEPDNQGADSRETGFSGSNKLPGDQGADSRETGFSGSNKLPGDQGADSRETGFSGSNKLPAKISSAAVRKPGDYEEFDASPDPRDRGPETFRQPYVEPTSKYEPEDTDRLDTGSRSPVNYNQHDIKRLTDLASRSGRNQPTLSTALIEPKNTDLGSYFTQKGGQSQKQPAASKPSNLGLGSYFTQKGGQSQKQPATSSVEPGGLNLNGLKSSNTKLIVPQEVGKTTSNNLNPDIIKTVNRADALKKIPKGNEQDYI